MTQSHVLILQHVPWEKPGRILDSLDDLGMSYEVMNIAKEKKPDLPDFSDVSGIVIMGGPMGALDTDKYPGLKAESNSYAPPSASANRCWACASDIRSLPPRWARTQKGSEPEIGFAPIKRIDKHDYFSMWNKTLDVLHWHNDVVTLPEGAQPLAKSAKTKNQAFRFGSALGLQFHLEVTPTLLDEWLDEPVHGEDLKAAGGSKSQLRDAFAEYNPQLQPMADQVFSGFAARCSTYAATLER